MQTPVCLPPTPLFLHAPHLCATPASPWVPPCLPHVPCPTSVQSGNAGRHKKGMRHAPPFPSSLPPLMCISEHGTPLTPLFPPPCPCLHPTVYGDMLPPPFLPLMCKGRGGCTWLHAAEMEPTPNPPPHPVLPIHGRMGWVGGVGVGHAWPCAPPLPLQMGSPTDDRDCMCACAPPPFGAPHPLSSPPCTPYFALGGTQGGAHEQGEGVMPPLLYHPCFSSVTFFSHSVPAPSHPRTSYNLYHLCSHSSSNLGHLPLVTTPQDNLVPPWASCMFLFLLHNHHSYWLLLYLSHCCCAAPSLTPINMGLSVCRYLSLCSLNLSFESSSLHEPSCSCSSPLSPQSSFSLPLEETEPCLHGFEGLSDPILT
jgi:hypothetical protein